MLTAPCPAGNGGVVGCRMFYAILPCPMPSSLQTLLAQPSPLLALAPMQDVTDLAFMRLMMRYGGPDLFFTEYFRITEGFRPNKEILRSITENDTGRPVIAQLIGNQIPWMIEGSHRLLRHPTLGIDLNLGCPAPVVYRKCAGGGLLRDPARVDGMIQALREALPVFTVKTRVGFEAAEEFDTLLEIFARHRIDLLSVHGRTVTEKYGPRIHLDRITQAVRDGGSPVLANGSVDSPENAMAMLEITGARGLMIGRGAIRNPWIFRQIREISRGQTPFQPIGRDVLAYIEDLFQSTSPHHFRENAQVQKMKKYMNFLAAGVNEQFLQQIRRVQNRADFFAVCRHHLEHEEPVALHVPSTLDTLVRV